jgi:hypothetical protein
VQHSTYGNVKALKINTVRIMGVSSATWVTVNKQNYGDFTFNSETKVGPMRAAPDGHKS